MLWDPLSYVIYPCASTHSTSSDLWNNNWGCIVPSPLSITACAIATSWTQQVLALSNHDQILIESRSDSNDIKLPKHVKWWYHVVRSLNNRWIWLILIWLSPCLHYLYSIISPWLHAHIFIIISMIFTSLPSLYFYTLTLYFYKYISL